MIKVEMTLEKTTKNTFRYAEDSDNPKIGTLYIRQGAVPVPSSPPKKIVVEVTIGKSES